MTIRSDLKRAAEAVMGMDYPWDHTVRDGRLGKTSTEYARLAHPSNVLALIEHNELLTARLCECKSCGGEGDLHSGDWHHYGHMEPPEPVMEKCGECDGSGRIGDIQDLDNSLAEIQRLKAECEGLRAALAASREFIMHDAETRRMTDGAGEVLPIFPGRKALVEKIDTAMSKESGQ